MFRSLVIIAGVVVAANAFGTGAPPSADICDNLTPKHHADPQKGASPYTIAISESVIHPGDEVKVTLAGINGAEFKGFLVQARTGNKVVGSFDVDGTNEKAQTIDCPNGKKNAATHTSPTPKSSITLKWTAPKDLEGAVVFKATFVKDGATFWVAQTSSSLTVRH